MRLLGDRIMRSQFHGRACYYCSANVRIIIYFDEVISHFAIRHLGGGAVPPKYLQLIHSKILFPGTLNILGLKKRACGFSPNHL